MLPQTLMDFGLSQWAMEAIRIVASIGAAIVGWVVCDPLTRITYRVSVQKATPGWLLPWAKLTGAGTLGAVVYSLVTFGSGGGLGWGPGAGPGPGPGPGPGDPIAVNGTQKDGKTKAIDPKNLDAKSKAVAERKLIEIEILGGTRFIDDGNNRYYLLRKIAENPHSPTELEDYFKKHKGKLEVRIIHTDDSILINTEEDPTRRLRQLATRYDIPTQGPKE